jgi:small conductance mechanosensitive channel
MVIEQRGQLIFNYWQCEQRRNDITLLLAHDADMKHVFEITKRSVETDARTKKDPAPLIAIGDIAENGIVFATQVWTDASVMGPVRSDPLQELQTQFCASDISFARYAPMPALARA